MTERDQRLERRLGLQANEWAASSLGRWQASPPLASAPLVLGLTLLSDRTPHNRRHHLLPLLPQILHWALVNLPFIDGFFPGNSPEFKSTGQRAQKSCVHPTHIYEELWGQLSH